MKTLWDSNSCDLHSPALFSLSQKIQNNFPESGSTQCPEPCKGECAPRLQNPRDSGPSREIPVSQPHSNWPCLEKSLDPETQAKHIMGSQKSCTQLAAEAIVEYKGN